MKPYRPNPYRNYKFRIIIDGRTRAGFSEVEGLTTEQEVIEYFEPERKRSRSAAPDNRRYEAITLERGVTHDREFEEWARKSNAYYQNPPNERPARDFRENIRFEIYNEAGQLAAAFILFRCWVSEYQALPDLDANANAVAIQTIVIQNEGWERDRAIGEPAKRE